MRILLSYSKRHFDPARPREAHEHWGSSASILARTFHGLLSELGDVTYVDPGEIEAVRGQAFDLFVGVPNRFGELVRACRIGRSIYLAVNRHPRERNYLLLRGMFDLKVPPAAVGPWELKTSVAEEAAIARADAILCVGNEATVDSYVRHGVPRGRIKRFNYGLLERDPAAADPRRPGPPRLVHVASEIGLRKGFDVVDDLVQGALGEGTDFELDLVGLPSTPHYQARLDRLCARAPDRIRWHGWIDSSSEAYAALLRGADFLLFPSLEEGQAGTVLDALGRGVVPLVTDRCGFDFAPLGYLEPRRGNAANQELVRRALALDDGARARLRAQTLAHYERHHAGFQAPLRRILARFVRGGVLHPKISVVLPVFNKEKTLGELLRHLDAAMARYPACELHLILDGCRDGSEAIARAFATGPRGYPVTIDVTPNVFEVKSNNLGLRRSAGEICAIVQDDNYLYDRALFYEAADLFDLDPQLAVLGGLAGVNFYPRGARPRGRGQIATTEQEVYWRQDANTDPALARRVFEVDACMRGPLFLRKSFLERDGYLDEAYAPLYMDDMDLCFRAWSRGWRVMAALMEVENRSLTMAGYSEERNRFFLEIWRRNTDLFYARYTPSTDKSGHTWLHRHHRPDVDPAAKLVRDAREALRRGWRGMKGRARAWRDGGGAS